MDYLKLVPVMGFLALSGCGGGGGAGSGGGAGEGGYHGEVTSLPRESTLRIMDTDGDNRITEEEWKQAQSKGSVPKRDFNTVDKDGNGDVKGDELVTYLAERVRVGKLSEKGTELREAEPTYLKLNLFSFPLKDGEESAGGGAQGGAGSRREEEEASPLRGLTPSERP